MTQRMRVVVADITTLEVDAIVNAANKTLLGGGGVDGAIHRAAGPELEDACRALGGCETGDAKVTPGFRLPAAFVIHAVGPVWGGNRAEKARLLASCYRRSLEEAERVAARSVAFPAISTGIYRYPPDQAAEIAVRTVAEVLEATEAIASVVFCCFSEESAAHHRRALAALE
jgi:O-acetyl-ADP-ribose deacetylase (regulator of RNase III)